MLKPDLSSNTTSRHHLRCYSCLRTKSFTILKVLFAQVTYALPDVSWLHKEPYLAGAAIRPVAPEGQHPSTSTVASGGVPASSLPTSTGTPSSSAMQGRSDPTEEQLRASTQTQELANRFK